MDRSKCPIVVTGATGKQGGAVARKLLADGWAVRAFVRDPGAPGALALSELGASLVPGDLDDAGSIARAVDGAYGVFSVQSWLADGVDAEERRGTSLASLASRARVDHFIYSSVGGADRNSGVPHFESKYRVERFIREIGLPFTIFRPVYFMENLLQQRDSICRGMLTPPINPDVGLQFIAVEDIADFVALAFRSSGGWLGHTTEIAGDECTFLEVAQILSDVISRSVDVQPPSYSADEGRRKMTRWLEEVGYDADITRLRLMVPTLLTLREWALLRFACPLASA